MKRTLLSAFVVAILLTGCGGDDGGQASQDGPAKTLDVASTTEYERTAVPLAERAVSVGEELPKLSSFGSESFSRRANSLANRVKRASDGLAPITPPAEVLSEHQFLTDSVTIVEFDLRDVAGAQNRRAAKDAMDRLSGDLQQLDDQIRALKAKLG